MSAGATLFPGDVIRLGETSTAALQFGNSVVLAAPDTEFVVESDGVNLRDGRLQVRADKTESFAISAAFFRVKVAPSGGTPGSAEVHLRGMRAQVWAVAGAADLTSVGSAAPYRLHAGESATVDAAGRDAAPAQDAASPAAGQVSRLTPQVQIDRAAQHIVAAVNDRVFWNDGLRSGPSGRAHVTLTDGSELNLGSESSLTILQHDAQAQQTSLDLLIGRLRGKVTKLTRPGGKFEIHTPVGVAGLVGTDFSLLVTNDYVELMVFEGAVQFTTLDGKSVTVNAGNKLRISRQQILTGPLPTTAQEVQLAQSLTDITGVGNAGTVAAAAGTSSRVPLVVILTGTAAGIGIGVWQGSRPAVSNSIP
jgi:ferric-dicitrate binding protein FerR (iron transport regulator)